MPSGNKVEQSKFTYKSLFNNGDIDDVNASEGQMSLFDDPEDSDSKKNKLTRLTREY